MSLKKLVCSLRSHKIELEEDEPQKKIKFVALKSTGKIKALQVEEEEDS